MNDSRAPQESPFSFLPGQRCKRACDRNIDWDIDELTSYKSMLHTFYHCHMAVVIRHR